MSQLFTSGGQSIGASASVRPVNIQGSFSLGLGDYSVILNSSEEAVCIIKTLKVYVIAFNQVSDEHAFKEGEGDRSLEYWRMVHVRFLTNELASVHKAFDEHTKVVCEEFEVVYH